jgi:hypothetical protein
MDFFLLKLVNHEANHNGVRVTLCLSSLDLRLKSLFFFGFTSMNLLLISNVFLMIVQNDVFLLTSNAMSYNSDDTVYYRQVSILLML